VVLDMDYAVPVGVGMVVLSVGTVLVVLDLSKDYHTVGVPAVLGWPSLVQVQHWERCELQ
jgi:hypothetical protein